MSVPVLPPAGHKDKSRRVPARSVPIENFRITIKDDIQKIYNNILISRVLKPLLAPGLTS